MTITKSGELASFYTVNKAPIKHLRVYFSPKQAGSGDPSPTNIRPINGQTELSITHCGKNLFDKNNIRSINVRILSTLGRLEENYKCLTIYIPCHPNTVYSIKKNATSRSCISYSTSTMAPKINDTTEGYINIAGMSSVTYTTGNSAKWLLIYLYNKSYDLTVEQQEMLDSVQITLGSTETAYESYSGTTIPVDWALEAGTVYGGYVDLISGILTVTQGYKVFDGSQDEEWHATSDGKNFYIMISDAKTQANEYLKCNCAISDSNGGTLETGECKISSTRNFNFRMGETLGISTISQLLDWLSTQNIEFTYRLETPVTYQLQSVQLETLIGRNNIWSDADRVEIEYDLAESNDELYRRRNILLRSVPHIETVSGNIINFQTDVVAPMKSAKINFSPIQGGSGTPSPTNVRAISGWTNLSLYHSGKNLYVPNSNNKGYISKSGVITVDETSTYTDLIPVNLGDVYSFECTTVSVNGDTNRRIHGYNSSGTWVKQLTSGTTAANTVEYRKISATIPADISYIRVSFRNQDMNVRIAKENISTAAWTAPLYSGELNLTTGQLIIYYKLCTITGTESNLTYNWDGLLLPVADSISDNQTIGIIACSHTNNFVRGGAFWSSARTTTNLTITDNPVCAACSQGSQLRFRKRDLDPEYTRNIELYRNWLKEQNSLGTPLQIVYKLIEPVTYQLSPQTIRTFSGINNIWSNTNDQISISYWTH